MDGLGEFLCGILVVLFAIMLIAFGVKIAGGVAEEEEQITDQQYKAQSLQYLEDIRNAVDFTAGQSAEVGRLQAVQ